MDFVFFEMLFKQRAKLKSTLKWLFLSCIDNHSRGKILTKKPLIATPEEIKANPRSRSAKLRAFEFGNDNAK